MKGSLPLNATLPYVYSTLPPSVDVCSLATGSLYFLPYQSYSTACGFNGQVPAQH